MRTFALLLALPLWAQVQDRTYSLLREGFLLVAANGSRARFVGYRPGAEVRWQIERHAYLQAEPDTSFEGEKE